MNKVYEGSRRFISNNKLSDFNTFLSKNSEIKIHQWNSEILIVEVNKKINYYAQAIMSFLFVFPGIARFGTICTI